MVESTDVNLSMTLSMFSLPFPQKPTGGAMIADLKQTKYNLVATSHSDYDPSSTLARGSLPTLYLPFEREDWRLDMTVMTDACVNLSV